MRRLINNGFIKNRLNHEKNLHIGLADNALCGFDTCVVWRDVVHNISQDTVTVTFHEEIISSPFHGFDIEENDSVTTHHGEDSVTVAVLAPNQHLRIHREWDGLYREELIVHGWQYISSIKIGETKVDSTLWNNEAAWHHRTKGGGRFAKEESHYYDLWFKD